MHTSRYKLLPPYFLWTRVSNQVIKTPSQGRPEIHILPFVPLRSQVSKGHEDMHHLSVCHRIILVLYSLSSCTTTSCIHKEWSSLDHTNKAAHSVSGDRERIYLILIKTIGQMYVWVPHLREGGRRFRRGRAPFVLPWAPSATIWDAVPCCLVKYDLERVQRMATSTPRCQIGPLRQCE